LAPLDAAASALAALGTEPLARITDIQLIAVKHHRRAGRADGIGRGLMAVRGAGSILLETDAGVQGVGKA
jgi:hypothetical protein